MKNNSSTVKKEESFLVIHPLDDVQEQKMDPNGLGAMGMTPLVKGSLITLRVYLILMVLMMIYHVLDLAGVWKI